MDRPLLLRYLTFLADTSSTLLQKDLIEDYDVSSLKRELQRFKDGYRGGASGSVAIDQSIALLDLKADERDADGETMGMLKVATKALFGRGLAWKLYEEKRQARVRTALEVFRKEVSHIAFAIEI
jgi:hypothetical protein